MNKCQYWNCNQRIRSGYFLCYEHFEDWEDELIDKCPSCGQYKDIEFFLCLACITSAPKKIPQSISGPSSKYKLEKSEAWAKKDKEADRFFVYILQDKNGQFYVGQTRELRPRLWEHKDGKTRSTAGREMELRYFEVKGSREEAAKREVELKRLVDTDERQVRKMIIDFKDNIGEVM